MFPRKAHQNKVSVDGFVTPPSSNSSDGSFIDDGSMEEEESSTSETVLIISDASDIEEEEEEEEEYSYDDISYICSSPDDHKYFEIVVKFMNERNIVLHWLHEMESGTRIKKLLGPFGPNDILKDSVFILGNKIIDGENRCKFIILYKEKSVDKYLIDLPYFLDWTNVQ